MSACAKLMGAQMDSLYFPITMEEFSASVTFRDLREETISLGDVEVSTLLLSHPGNCLGYRLSFHGKSICYITDNEIFPEGLPQRNEHYIKRLSNFVAGSDILITATTYRDEDYKSKIGWGHSCISEAADLVTALADRGSKVRVIAPAENDIYSIS